MNESTNVSRDNTRKPDGYDLIGDIHGHADELKALLDKMGYALRNGAYSHPTHQVIFLGDFIDSGPKQKETVSIVSDMIVAKQALAVMGNHEFNALAYHTEHPDRPGEYLRPRNERNTNQHQAFLDEYGDSKSETVLERALEFFRSLPLWLDLGDLRVVHACWHSFYINELGSRLEKIANKLDADLLVSATDKYSEDFLMLETILKGVEYPLPNGETIQDKGGTLRGEVRLEWWHNEGKKLNSVALPKKILGDRFKDHDVSVNKFPGYSLDAPPLFVGHYWMEGHPSQLASNIACLDYSVAKEGKLVGYRWAGEKKIQNDHFIF